MSFKNTVIRDETELHGPMEHLRKEVQRGAGIRLLQRYSSLYRWAPRWMDIIRNAGTDT